jgi:hypothetical protein
MHRLFVVGLTLLAACSGDKDKDNKDEQTTKPAEVGDLVRGDGGVTAVVTAVDPSERHLDEDVTDRPVQTTPQPARAGRPIDVTLRSTPPGAQVAVDGMVLGNTPAFWSGMADGREHEFVFTMRGHAIARYRFVPVASGVIHGRLDPIHEDSDAGTATPPPEVMPPRPPTTPSVNPPSAPPTIVQPDAPISVTPPGASPAPAPAPESGSAPVGPQP